MLIRYTNNPPVIYYADSNLGILLFYMYNVLIVLFAVWFFEICDDKSLCHFTIFCLLCLRKKLAVSFWIFIVLFLKKMLSFAPLIKFTVANFKNLLYLKNLYIKSPNNRIKRERYNISEVKFVKNISKRENSLLVINERPLLKK